MKKIICLPLILFILSCSGGKGPATSSLPGLSGEFCVEDDTYTIDDAQGEQSLTIEAEPFIDNFLGNIGGQIRAVSDVFLSIEDAEPATVLLWGTGSSIRAGQVDSILGTAPLKNRGVITSIQNYGDPAAPYALFGSQRGLGIIEISGISGKLDYKEKKFKSIPGGVLSTSVINTGASNNFYFTSGLGYVLATTESDFDSNSKCYGILASPSTFSSSGADMYPAKAVTISSKAFILTRNSKDVNLSPTIAQAFDPILEGLIDDSTPYTVQMLDTDSKNVTPVDFPSDTDGFYGFDRFIPTDIATDGDYLYVAGFGYEKAALDSLINSDCDKPTMEEKVECLREKANDGSLSFLKTSSGLDAATAGFFIYRDLDKVGESSAFFARIPLPVFLTVAGAPPLISRLAVENDIALVRGSNFLAFLEKTLSSSSEEKWTIKTSVDGKKGLLGGIPAQVGLFTDSGQVYGVTTAVSAKDSMSAGFSEVEVITPEGIFYPLDSGAMTTLMEDGSGNYLEAIELISDSGGVLYLENIGDRTWINPSSSSAAYAGRAAYDGSNLAFTWSAPNEAWHISWQKGNDSSTKGTYNISLTGDSTHFVDFPDVGSSDVDELKDTRKIIDLKLSNGKLFALLYGYYDGKHYYQALVYGASLSSGIYQITQQGSTNTISFNGDAEDTKARFQKITKNSDGRFTALFSCASGLRKFSLTPSSSSPPTVSATSLFSTANVVDLGIDESANQFAFIAGRTIRLRSLDSPTVDISATGLPQQGSETKLAGASIILKSPSLFIATPSGTTAPFWIIDISDTSSPKLTLKCNVCDFNGLAYFKTFGTQLLVSSDTGGVEIYDISNFD